MSDVNFLKSLRAYVIVDLVLNSDGEFIFCCT